MSAPAAIRRKSTERIQDERDLTILRRYVRGEGPKAIAASLGVGRSLVCAAVARVRDADIAQSGEPAGAVRMAYDRRWKVGAA